MYEDQKNAQYEAGIPDPVYDKGLFARIAGAFPLQIKTDEQVRAKAHPLPSHEHEDKIIRQDERKHGEHEEIQKGEETVVAGIIPHVSGRIDVNQEPDPRHDQDHHGRKRIKLKSPGYCKLREPSSGQREGPRV